jgi:fatty-acid desaturase
MAFLIAKILFFSYFITELSIFIGKHAVVSHRSETGNRKKFGAIFFGNVLATDGYGTGCFVGAER